MLKARASLGMGAGPSFVRALVPKGLEGMVWDRDALAQRSLGRGSPW